MSELAGDCVAAFRHRGRAFRLHGFAADDAIFRAVVERGTFYESDLLDYVRYITAGERAPGAIAVDVGANIGNHSVYLGAFVCDTVMAIEPNPAVLPVLQRNVADNGGNIALRACAVGEAEGQGRVTLPDTAIDNIGMARIALVGDGQPEGGCPPSIAVRTVDALVGELLRDSLPGARVLVMKIDVEGMETSVLKGARETLSAHHPHLFIEAWSGAELAALREQLDPYGYVVLGHWAATPVYHFAWRPGPALRVRAFLYTRIVRAWYRITRVARIVAGKRKP